MSQLCVLCNHQEAYHTRKSLDGDHHKACSMQNCICGRWMKPREHLAREYEVQS